MSGASVAQWARADPAGRDALLALAERAVALQPAAEAGIQRCQPGPDQAGGAQDTVAVRDAYRSLRDQLGALGVEAEAAADLGGLLDRHLDALEAALEGSAADGRGSGGLKPSPPEGLGAPAGRLVGLRDLLRRTVAIGGRPVSDVTPGV